MPENRDRLLELAEAVSDGRPVDWERVESGTEGKDARLLIEQLKVVASISEVHAREVLGPEKPAPAAAPAGPGPGVARIAGRYLVLGEVGHGGFGAVLRALDQRLGRTVALKLLDRVADPSPQDRARFDREAVILASLDHPNIIPIYDAGMDGDRPYFAMKLVQGRSLARRLRGGPLPEAEAVKVALQVAAALEHAHARSVLHRDIKPSNILEDVEGRVYLADFGISAASFLPHVTARGAIVGTLPYMAPEALSGVATERTDLYSLGAVLHEMLLGRPCFQDEDPRRLIKRICDERPSLADPPADVSPALLGLLGRLLEKDPERRPPSVAAMRAELEGLAACSGPLSLSESPTLVRVEDARPTDPGDRIEPLARMVEELGRLCEGPSGETDAFLGRLSDFVAEASRLAEDLKSARSGPGGDGALQAIVLSLGHLAREVQGRIGARLSREADSPLEGYLIRLQKSVLAPAQSLLREIEAQSAPQPASSDEFFGLEEPLPGTAAPAGEVLIEDLVSEDDLRRHEAVLAVAGSGLDPFLSAVRALRDDERSRVLEALWQKADVLLLEGRGRALTAIEAAIALSASDALRERWSRLHSLFQRSGAAHPDPGSTRRVLESASAGDRRVLGRALLFHPWEPYRRLALEVLSPPDFWEVIAHPGTSVPWLLTIWRHLEPRVSAGYLKVFFVCVRDTLLRAGGPERIVSVVEIVKEFYEADAFHEDVFFKMLIDLDEKVRAEARRHKLLVDFDAGYVERFRAFLAKGTIRDQPIEGLGAVPLPVQRRLARKGYFLKYFVCHPVDPIALECLAHLVVLEDVTEYVAIFSINARLIVELAKEKHLFVRESARYALVANPKTPAHIVLSHIRFLRKDNLRRLSESRECNQLSRNYALNILGRK